MNTEVKVYVVDDDADMRRSLRWLIESIGVAVEDFASAEGFLAENPLARQGCLVLDDGLVNLAFADEEDAEIVAGLGVIWL